MRRRAFGPRFFVEAVFLGVVALVAAFAGLQWTAIVLVMAVAYLLVVVFDFAVSRAGRWPRRTALRPPQQVDQPPEIESAAAIPEHQHVHVLPAEAEPSAQPVLEGRRESEPAPESEPPPAPEPLPPGAEPVVDPVPPPRRPPETEPEPEQPEPVAEANTEDEPEPEPEPPPDLEPPPEPEPIARPALEVVEPPQPEPEPKPDGEAAQPVVRLPVRGTPREWNVWELERLVRRDRGRDTLQDEERSYVLVYLRGFATPEGTLPADFDELVRDSFGELLPAP